MIPELSSAKEYWLHKASDEVVGHLEEVHTKWSLWTNSPFRQAWVRNFVAYYSPVVHPGSWDTSLIFEGIQGELIRMYTPQARTMIRDLVTIVTKNRLAVQCMAQTSGSAVVDDLKLGNALADQIIQRQRLDVKAEKLVELALVTGAAFTHTKWRTDLGQPHVRTAEGALIYDGDCEISVVTPFDVFYDVSVPEWENLTWVEIRVVKNRYDLLAQHPELQDEILKLPSVRQERGPNSWFDRTFTDDDLVYCYELYVPPRPALPQGRMMMYSSPKCVYYDDINQYGCIPIEPLIPEGVFGTTLGYPQFTNLMPAQEMFDNSLSAIATNQAQFAVQSLTMPRGANVNVQEVGGMRFIAFTPQNVPGGGKPEPLQLTQSSPETFKFADVMKANMLEMSRINGALRGTPPPGATSGVAIATLSANALEFTSSLTKMLHVCLEKTMEKAFKCYEKFATLPHSITVKGPNNQSTDRKFEGKDLANIVGLKFTMQNPLMQTVAGRLEVAEKLLQMPREVWGDYVSVLEGEPLTNLYKSEVSEEDLINGENEKLMAGEQVPCLITDDHAKHIKDHIGLLNNPEVRMSGNVNQIILAHVMEHYNQSKQAPPDLIAMVRTGKIPEGMMMPQPPMGTPTPMPQGGPGGAVAGPKPAHPAEDKLGRSAEP